MPAAPGAVIGLTGPPAIGGDAGAAVRGGLSSIALQTVVRLAALGSVVAVTRHLSPDEFGRYSTVAAVVLVASIAADAGTSTAITRLTSRTPGAADSLLAGTLLGSLLLGALTYAAAVGFAAIAYSPTSFTDVAIGALAIPGLSMVSSILGALDGEGLSARRAWVTALQGLIVAGGMLPVVAGAGVRAPIIALAAAPWAALAVAVTMARRTAIWRSRLRLDIARTWALLRMALPFGISGALTVLTMRFDIVLLSVLASTDETASYDIAVRALEAIGYLSTAICGPLLFILNRRMAAGDHGGVSRAYGQAVRLMYLLGLPLSVTLVLMARPLVVAAFGPGFGSAAAPLAIMGAAQWLAFVIVVQGALVMSGGAVGRGIAVGAMVTLATVVLGVALIPAHGAVGASVASVLGWACGFVALDRFHRRHHAMATPLPAPGILAAVAAMALVLAGLRDAPVFLALAGGGTSYLSVLLATRSVGSADVHRLRSAFAGQRHHH